MRNNAGTRREYLMGESALPSNPQLLTEPLGL
jgi:hypothetical protein